jgi:hypothetical protein
LETLKNVRNGLVALPSHSRREIADEFNLRKALRWCDLLDGPGSKEFHADVDLAKEDNDQFGIMSAAYFNAIVLQRLETEEEHLAAVAAFKQVFGRLSLLSTRPSLRKSVPGDWVRVGQVVLQCKRAVNEFQRFHQQLFHRRAFGTLRLLLSQYHLPGRLLYQLVDFWAVKRKMHAILWRPLRLYAAGD